MEVALEVTVIKKNIMNKNILIVLMILQSFTTPAQVPVNNFTPKEKLYLQTLQQAAAYLKSKPTKYFGFHQTETYSKDEAFYDTVISKFFNKEKMNEIFKKNTDVFAVEGKFDILRHLLNGCDYNLDFIVPDSIFIRPERYRIKDFTNKDDSIRLTNTLEIFYKVTGREITVLSCDFDSETNKFLSLSPMGTSDVAENNLLINFLHRQKNFYKYPIKRSLDK